MKGTTYGQVTTIGMFIINDNGEIFLCQHYDEATRIHVWNIPYLLHDNAQSTVYTAAQNYLQSLGLCGELHEVFGKEHAIIVLTTFNNTEISTQSANYDWHDMHRVVRDTREHPAHYASLLKTSLEGIVLYLKTHLKNSITVENFTRFEL
ncbi:MAG: hypothetical protein WC365_03050 [Candidatus Babeliales bacterium]